VSGQVKRKPPVPEGTGLQARRIGHGDDKQATGYEQACRVGQRPGGPAEMLE
jgi:hypothetical protein